MTDLRKAAEQALEVLEQLHGGCTDSDDGTVEAITVWCPEVIEALRAALAAEQAPDAAALEAEKAEVYRLQCSHSALYAEVEALKAGTGPLLESISQLEAEVEALRKFAQSVMEAWPMGEIDGGDLQDLAVDCGLLVPEQRFAPCHEELCSCAEYAQPDEWAAGVECFRKTPLLTGAIDAARAQKGE